MVLLASGLLALSFNVAVRVLVPPGDKVKLKGETERVVDVLTFSFSTVIVPYEYPVLAWYWLSPANDAVTVTDVWVVTVGAV